MIKSMTGFGKSILINEQREYQIEMKSVNHRYLDINVRIPRQLMYLEETIKKVISSQIKRGKIEVFINFQDKKQEGEKVLINKDMAKSYIHQLQEIAKETDISEEDIIYALDAIATPMSLFEPVYQDGNDPLFLMDQICDKKNKEETWVEHLSLQEAMNQLPGREYHIIKKRFFEGKTQTEVANEISISQAQVSRLEKNALKSIRNFIEKY